MRSSFRSPFLTVALRAKPRALCRQYSGRGLQNPDKQSRTRQEGSQGRPRLASPTKQEFVKISWVYSDVCDKFARQLPVDTRQMRATAIGTKKGTRNEGKKAICEGERGSTLPAWRSCG